MNGTSGVCVFFCLGLEVRNRWYTLTAELFSDQTHNNEVIKRRIRMKKRTLVVGIFTDAGSAVDAIQELRRSSFSDDQLGFVVRYNTDKHGCNILARDIIDLLATGAVLPLPVAETSTPVEQIDSALIVEEKPQDTQEKNPARFIIGGVIGGTLGTVATLQLPGIGPVVAGGTLIAPLGVAAAGSLTPSFLSIGISEHKSSYYEQQFQAGSIILTVKAATQQQEAQDVLHYHRACSIEVH